MKHVFYALTVTAACAAGAVLAAEDPQQVATRPIDVDAITSIALNFPKITFGAEVDATTTIALNYTKIVFGIGPVTSV